MEAFFAPRLEQPTSAAPGKCAGSMSVPKRICSWWMENPLGFTSPRTTPSPAYRPSKAQICADEPDTVLGGGGTDAVFFEVARDSGELVRLIVRQAGGIEVEFRFENWRFDPTLPHTMFRFEPPTRVAIVNGELPDGQTQGK